MKTFIKNSKLLRGFLKLKYPYLSKQAIRHEIILDLNLYVSIKSRAK